MKIGIKFGNKRGTNVNNIEHKCCRQFSPTSYNCHSLIKNLHLFFRVKFFFSYHVNKCDWLYLFLFSFNCSIVQLTWQSTNWSNRLRRKMKWMKVYEAIEKLITIYSEPLEWNEIDSYKKNNFHLQGEKIFLLPFFRHSSFCFSLLSSALVYTKYRFQLISLASVKVKHTEASLIHYCWTIQLAKLILHFLLFIMSLHKMNIKAKVNRLQKCEQTIFQYQQADDVWFSFHFGTIIRFFVFIIELPIELQINTNPSIELLNIFLLMEAFLFFIRFHLPIVLVHNLLSSDKEMNASLNVMRLK